MKQILLQIITDSTKVIMTKSKSGFSQNYWFWIAAAELGVILFLATKLVKKKEVVFDTKTEDLLNSSKSTNIDMTNLMDSINKSRDLYKLLSSKCHPDRFLDAEKNKLADDLFQEITKSQRNYARLLELKETAINKLNITI